MVEEFAQEEEIEITIEELVIQLLERVEYLEDCINILAEDQQELGIDHQALFMVMRSTGKFSKGAYIKARSILTKDLEEHGSESTTDDIDVEGDGRG
jgi:hypothetical protein